MRGIVFATLRQTALNEKQYASDMINKQSLQCKGCGLFYQSEQVMLTDHIGNVCYGCARKLAQMFLQ